MASFSSVLLPLHQFPPSTGTSDQRQQQQQVLLRGASPLSLTPQTAKRLLLQHKEWRLAAIFTGSAFSVATTFSEPADFGALVAAFASREAAISKGVPFLGHTYAVTRYAPPLIVCRRGSLDVTEGLAILKVREGFIANGRGAAADGRVQTSRGFGGGGQPNDEVLLFPSGNVACNRSPGAHQETADKATERLGSPAAAAAGCEQLATARAKSLADCT
ncbi:hypothetical protein Esti_005409 [Eimeria stiedai]